MTPLTTRQKILIPCIILSFAYVIWQLYAEYSLALMEPRVSAQLLLASTEKLGRTLSEEQSNLADLATELKRANQPMPAPMVNALGSTTPELSEFAEDLSKQYPPLNTPINWKEISTIPPVKKILVASKPSAYTPVEQQLLATPKQFYTLQIMADRRIRKLMAVATHPSLQGKTKLLGIKHRGENWHILLYGIYPDHRSAKRAEKSLPPSLQQLHIWIRPLSNLHLAIKNRR